MYDCCKISSYCIFNRLVYTRQTDMGRYPVCIFRLFRISFVNMSVEFCNFACVVLSFLVF